MKHKRGDESSKITDERRGVERREELEAPEGALERRKFLKMGGAFAAAGAAALALPKSLRGQDGLGGVDELNIKEGEDVLVDAKTIVDATSTMVSELQGPSDGLKAELGEQLAGVSASLKAQDGEGAIEQLEVFRETVHANLDELNASNGGLEIAGLGADGGKGGIGDGLLALAAFLIGLGPGIIFFLVVILWARILWIIRCMINFARCLGFAQNFFMACLALCLVFFAIPGPLGAALAGACAVVCRALTAAIIRACIANFIACLRAC